MLYSEMNASMTAFDLQTFCGNMMNFKLLAILLLANQGIYISLKLTHLTIPSFFDDFAWYANITVIYDSGKC